MDSACRLGVEILFHGVLTLGLWDSMGKKRYWRNFEIGLLELFLLV